MMGSEAHPSAVICRWGRKGGVICGLARAGPGSKPRTVGFGFEIPHVQRGSSAGAEERSDGQEDVDGWVDWMDGGSKWARVAKSAREGNRLSIKTYCGIPSVCVCAVCGRAGACVKQVIELRIGAERRGWWADDEEGDGQWCGMSREMGCRSWLIMDGGMDGWVVGWIALGGGKSVAR